MQRREFLRVLCSAAVAWPTVTRAQQQTMRHIAVLMATKDTDPDGRARLDAFLQSFLTTRLGRWPKRQGRHPMVRRQLRAHPGHRCGIGCGQA